MPKITLKLLTAMVGKRSWKAGDLYEVDSRRQARHLVGARYATYAGDPAELEGNDPLTEDLPKVGLMGQPVKQRPQEQVKPEAKTEAGTPVARLVEHGLKDWYAEDLAEAGVATVEDLQGRVDAGEDLTKLSNIGSGKAKAIKTALAAYGAEPSEPATA